MKKRIIYSLIITLCLFVMVGCNKNNLQNDISDENKKSSEVTKNLKIIINNMEYTLNLEDNETTRVLISLLPMEFDMHELNSNEKYNYLDTTLPTSPTNPEYINKGDVMLYGNNCLVIFYESFDTSYSYTRLGHIDNLPDLGNKSIKVRIEK